MKTSEQIFSQIVEGELTQIELHSLFSFLDFQKMAIIKEGHYKIFH